MLTQYRLTLDTIAQEFSWEMIEDVLARRALDRPMYCDFLDGVPIIFSGIKPI